MKFLRTIKSFCDYIGGSGENPPPEIGWLISQWWWRGLWWGMLAIVICAFCGQTSKFIYIDF
ncbi:MAG TPA: hypothetical protein VG754_09450 [Verrucomicrobiae bacterium]|nr:hypothetical protein [Verrucomicrobiae bacterium]